MAITYIYLNNLSANPLSVDVEIDQRRNIRQTIPVGGRIEVSSIASLEDLNRSAGIRRLRGLDPVGTPVLSITVEDTDSDKVATPPETEIGAEDFDFALKFGDDGTAADDTPAMATATAAGFLRVKVGGSVRYVQLYSGTPST